MKYLLYEYIQNSRETTIRYVKDIRNGKIFFTNRTYEARRFSFIAAIFVSFRYRFSWISERYIRRAKIIVLSVLAIFQFISSLLHLFPGGKYNAFFFNIFLQFRIGHGQQRSPRRIGPESDIYWKISEVCVQCIIIIVIPGFTDCSNSMYFFVLNLRRLSSVGAVPSGSFHP